MDSDGDDVEQRRGRGGDDTASISGQPSSNPAAALPSNVNRESTTRSLDR